MSYEQSANITSSSSLMKKLQSRSAYSKKGFNVQFGKFSDGEEVLLPHSWHGEVHVALEGTASL